jgi:hypothetical protein
MACVIPNKTPEQIFNMLKNRELMVEAFDEISDHHDFARAVNFIKTLVNAENEDHKYMMAVGSAEMLVASKSVSDIVKMSHERRRGKWKDKVLSETKDSIIKREMGSFIHKVAENIMFNIIGESKLTKDQIRKHALKNLNETQFKELEEGVKALHKQITEIQNKIDPDKKPAIMIEAPVFDPIEDMGGTIDIFVRFSDMSGAIYDYKSISQADTYAGKLISPIVHPMKGEEFKMQLGEYARIAKENYGVTKLREVRVVPIHARFQMKEEAKKGKGKKGEGLTGKLYDLKMTDKSSEFLRQFAIPGEEEIADSKIAELILEKENLIKGLERRAKSEKDRDKKEAIYSRISSIRNSIQALLVGEEIETMFNEILLLTREIEEIENLNDLDFGDLDNYLNQLNLYNTVPKYTQGLMEELEKDKDKKKIAEKVRKRSDLVGGQVANAFAKIQGAMDLKIVEKLDPREVEDGRMKAQPKLDGFDRYLTRLSEIDHPLFRMFKSNVDNQNNETRMEFMKVAKEVNEKHTAFIKWGKGRGMSRMDANKVIVNMETGNLYGKLTKEWYESVDEAIARGDIDWLKKHFELRGGEENYKSRYKEERARVDERKKKQFNNLKDRKLSDGTVVPASFYKKKYDSAMATWEKHNNLLESTDAWLNEKTEYDRNIKKDVMEKNYSKEYKRIISIKEAKDFYELHEKMNSKFRELLGANSGRIPNNFIANVRKDMYEKMKYNRRVGISSGFSELLQSLSIREEDYELIDRDTVTGETSKKAPILFTNRFTKDDGSLDIDEKSFDLGKNLLLMTKMAYNYHNMNKIEAEVNAIIDFMARNRIQEVDTKGNIVKNTLAKAGLSSNEVQLMQTLRDYYIYGIKYAQRGKTFSVLGTDVNTTRLLQKTKAYYSKKNLAFAVLPAAAQLIHGKIGAFIEAEKGMMFNKKQWLEAEKFQTFNRKNIDMMHALGQHFDIYTESELDRAIYKESREKHKYLERAMFAPLRRTDEAIDNTILGAMMRNYGLDENGNHRRLKGLPEGTKSYWDLLDKEHWEKTGEIKIEGIDNDSFIHLKNAVQKGAIKVKGAVSDDDIAGYQASIYADLFMQFKTWMPGLLKERIGKIRYDHDLDLVEYGRYRAVMDEFSYAGSNNAFEYITKTFLGKSLELAWDIATFGFSKSMSKIEGNETKMKRAKLQFQRFLQKNPHLKDKISFEQYIEAKQAAIRAAVMEFRVVLVMAQMTWMMGALTAGDDDKEKGKDGKRVKDGDLASAAGEWGARTIYKVLARSANEVGFTLNPAELWRVVKNPIPLVGLITDVVNTIGNTVDEGVDLVSGREDKRDRTPPGYYSRRWIIGLNQLFRLFDFFYEEDKKGK